MKSQTLGRLIAWALVFPSLALPTPLPKFSVWQLDRSGHAKKIADADSQVETQSVRSSRESRELYRLSGLPQGAPQEVLVDPSVVESLADLSMYASKFRDETTGFGVPRPDGNIQVARYEGPGLVFGPDGEPRFQPVFSYRDATGAQVQLPVEKPAGLPKDWFNRVAVDPDGGGPTLVKLIDIRNFDATGARVLHPDVFRAAQTATEPIPVDQICEVATDRLIYLTGEDRAERAGARAEEIGVAPLSRLLTHKRAPTDYYRTVQPTGWVDPTADPQRAIAKRRADGTRDGLRPGAAARQAAREVAARRAAGPRKNWLRAFIDLCRRKRS